MTQESFSTLWGSRSSGVDSYETHAAAKAARDARYRELRKQGTICRRWTLANQTRQYWGFGDPCGLSCNVYMISVS